jgi:phytoene desaturase
MNHIDFNMGVFYPQGGMYKITEALVNIAKKNGVNLVSGNGVKQIIVEQGKAVGVELESREIVKADIVVSNADMTHTEMNLLPAENRQYDEKYWDKKVLAPSALIMYLGIKGKVDSLVHHNLLFSQDWRTNFKQIFDDPMWPEDPSLYVCAPSKTDPSVAPAEDENLFVLVPIAAGLEYTEEQLQAYADKVLAIMQEEMNITDLKDRIIYKRLYSVKDFQQDYNAYKGTALGLAHTINQTAIFRPNNYSKKVKNLYYVGAGTNPGIGVPIQLISAEMVYKRIAKIKQDSPLGGK